MRKRKNLLKALTLCSLLGLGIGYAVIGNQTLTYTENIPVGSKQLDVYINHANASEDGK